MDAVLFSLHFVPFCIKITKTTREIRWGVRVWSSPVMTPASHAGNPEFESRRAYKNFYFFNFNHACCKKMFVGRCAAGTTGYAVTGNTHNAPPFLKTLYALRNVQWPLTWPGCRFDQKGTAPSVEQGHCTLIAVKRYRDPPRIGGRHNFLLLLGSNHFLKNKNQNT